MTVHLATLEERAARGVDAQRLVVLDAVKEAPYSTERELAEFFGIDFDILANRLTDLWKDGLVKEGETRVCHVVHRRRATWAAVVVAQ